MFIDEYTDVMKTVAIINTKASRAVLSHKEFTKLFEEADVALDDLILLKQPEDLPKVLRTVLKNKPDTVVVGGGDGTLMAYADIAKELNFSGNLAILPVGTANYLARNLDIPLDLSAAVRLVNDGHPKTISLPRANATLFSLLVSVGVIAAASGSVSVRFKRKAGQLAYLVESIKQLFRHDSFAYEIKTGSGRELRGRSHQIVLINADMSKQIELIPDNELSKPNMTLTIFDTKSSKMRLLISVILYITSFGHIRQGLNVIDDTEFEIHTTPSNEVSVDGEINFKTPVRIIADESRISILCPNGDVVG